ncbi:hypothetical protein M011DRAFT_523918 [Sporormia fimetaria CBS 119925]|uniref:Uncharacterized protein n=1 Tax=Sporormia fimetaria CBS 119925 TaxID=1340428 RepID=A0A6A6VMR0_9PLEO|nr:hypothetical protein M011DRAFT_523918 [Sporormia fimetaria CBS 119925]
MSRTPSASDASSTRSMDHEDTDNAMSDDESGSYISDSSFNAPQPPPKDLTFSNPPDAQSASPLFRLPPEIRNHVYAYAETNDIPLFSPSTGLISSVYTEDPCHIIELLQTCQYLYQEVQGPIHKHPYCRRAVVKALTDYYVFLSKLYFPESYILHAPPGGWPLITPEFCAPKNEDVMDLLKHIPYLAPTGDETGSLQDEFPQIYDEAMPCPYYRGREKGGNIHDGEPYDFQSLIPNHVIGLTWREEETGYLILFDTERGTWTPAQFGDWEIPGGGQALEDLEDDGYPLLTDHEGHTEEWRLYQYFSTDDFFDLLTRHWVNLDMIPAPEKKSYKVSDGRGYNVHRALCRHYGWPTDMKSFSEQITKYRKDELIARLRILKEIDYYDSKWFPHLTEEEKASVEAQKEYWEKKDTAPHRELLKWATRDSKITTMVDGEELSHVFNMVCSSLLVGKRLK